MGRKKAELDYTVIDTALFYGATLTQLQYLLERKGNKVSTKTIERVVLRDKKMKFTEYRDYHHNGAKLKLSQKQFEVAMSGNVSMLIWLGKQWLGQRDQHDIETKNENKIVIEKQDDKL